jgi:hypothetical protein
VKKETNCIGQREFHHKVSCLDRFGERISRLRAKKPMPSETRAKHDLYGWTQFLHIGSPYNETIKKRMPA